MTQDKNNSLISLLCKSFFFKKKDAELRCLSNDLEDQNLWTRNCQIFQIFGIELTTVLNTYDKEK